MKTAAFAGICADCGGRIFPGQEIETVDGNRWQHVSCPADPPAIAKNEILCDQCFLIHPIGACDQ